MTAILDNFNRANSDTLGTSSDGLFTWSEVLGDNDIASSTTLQSGAEGNNRSRIGPLSSTNHYAQVDVVAMPAAAGLTAAVCTRFDASSDTCYMFLVRQDTNNYRFYKVVAGTLTQIGSTVTEAIPSVPFTIRLESNGTTHTCYVNGVAKITQTDSSLTTGTHVGVNTGRVLTNNVAIDNFIACDLDVLRDFTTPQQVFGDAVWSWFSSPRAVYDPVNQVTYSGGVSSAGHSYAVKYDHLTGRTDFTTLKFNLEADDHDNAIPWIRPDGKIQYFYLKHNDTTGLRYRVSTSAGSIRAFDAEQVIGVGTDYDVSYANPIYLSQNGALYLFHRSRTAANTNMQWGYNKSTDFASFGTMQKIVRHGSSSTVTPYCVYTSNGVDRIDVCWTDMHPVNGQSSVYHLYMKLDGSNVEHWYKSDGTEIIASKPYAPADCTLVSDGTTVRRWVWQAGYDANGYPKIVGTRYPANDGSDIRYMLWRWNGSAWTEVEITTAGTGIYSPEIYYAGGICFDGNDDHRLWVSVEVSGHYEMQTWESTDGGATWGKTRDITTGTTGTDVHNARPFSPKGYGAGSNNIAVVYWGGRYTTYIDYNTAVYAAFLPLVPMPQASRRNQFGINTYGFRR